MLLIKVSFRGIEGGMVHGDEAPSSGFRGHQIAFEPVAQLRGGPIEIGIGVDGDPMSIAIVEREGAHALEGRSGAGQHGLDIGWVAFELTRLADGIDVGAIERLIPVIIIGLRIGILSQVSGGGIVVARHADHRPHTQQRHGIAVVDGIELLAIFADQAAGIDDVTSNLDKIRLPEMYLAGNLFLGEVILAAVAEDGELVALLRRPTSQGATHKDHLAIARHLVVKLNTRPQTGQFRRVHEVRFNAPHGDPATSKSALRRPLLAA